MDKRTRALRALRGESVDRAPLFFYRHFPEPDDDNRVKVNADWARKSNLDIMVAQIDGFDGCPIERVTGTIEDFAHLKPINRNHPFIQGQLDRAKRISEELAGEMAVVGILYTPFNNVRKSMRLDFDGMDMEYAWRNHNQIVRDAVEYARDCNDLLMELYKEETALDGLMISFRRNHKTFQFDDEEFKAEMLPIDAQQLDHMNALFDHNIMHICGDLGPNDLSLWNELPYQTVNWDMHVEKVQSLKEGREFFKPGTTLMGGFDHRDGAFIYTADKESLKAYVRDMVAEVGQQQLVICSDCSVKSYIEPERFSWIIEALEEAAQ